MNIRNKIAGTLAAAGIGLSALVGGCAGSSALVGGRNIDKPEYFKETINPRCINVDYYDSEIELELEWCNFFELIGFAGDTKGAGEIRYRNNEDELVRIEATSQDNLSNAIPTLVYTSSTGSIPLSYNKELADRVNAKWVELCKKLGCKGLAEKQSKNGYRYFNVKL